jgi:hypothetical protein
MKRFIINTALWYVVLSLGMFIVFILFGIYGHLGIRLLIAIVFALIKPFDKIIEQFKNQ